MYVGLNWHPIYLSYETWMIICGVYILVASVTPVWILLQPRDYLSSFLLYGMMILAVVGIIGCHPSIDAMPAFTGFTDTLAPTGTSLGYLFPALFVTIACGAISGFHSLVGSGTTAKQLNNERDARPIAYGGMLIESALAIISLCAVAYIWKDYADGTTVVPTAVFAGGLSSMLGTLFGACSVGNLLDEKGNVPNMDKAMLADAIATCFGAVCGTSTVTTFVESASGVEAGGRTGLTSLTSAFMFLACMFIAPVAAVIPAAATSSALIYVGILMLQGLKNVDFDDLDQVVPVFLMLLAMPISGSIGHGIGIAMIT